MSNNTIFWDVTPCSPVVHRRFGGRTPSIIRVEE
jgi:hypothetical protein